MALPRTIRPTIPVLLLAIAVVASGCAWIQRVSVSDRATQGNGASLLHVVSEDGAFVAFHSFASNLVANDTNGEADVFIHRRSSGVTDRVSVSSTGVQGNGFSGFPAISASGWHVAFESSATNLVPGDTNGVRDIFVRNRFTGTTQRVSVASDGTEANGASARPSISPNGRFVAFESVATNLVPNDTNGARDIFVHDLATKTTFRASVGFSLFGGGVVQADDDSFTPSVTSRAKPVEQGGGIEALVAFSSNATNLVSGDTNGLRDVFLNRRIATTVPSAISATTRESVSSPGTQAVGGASFAPALAADGNSVAFASLATNLVPGDTNGRTDVFVRRLDQPATIRASVSSGLVQGNDVSTNPSMSADGRYVGFESQASNLVAGDTNNTSDAFRHDLLTSTTIRTSVTSTGAQVAGDTRRVQLDGSGDVVAFETDATTVVPMDTNNTRDVFTRVVGTGTTTRVSVGSEPEQAQHDLVGPTNESALNHSGRFVAFESRAPNLVEGDGNGFQDVFVRDTVLGRTEAISVTSTGTTPNQPSHWPSVSASGRYVTFHSAASNIAPKGSGIAIFVRDRDLGVTSLVSQSTDGVLGSGHSRHASISANGRYVAFESEAANLVPLDSNGVSDIFLRDLVAGTTVRVSVSSSGAQANGASWRPAVADDGTVAFLSAATNLVANDTNGFIDVFVRTPAGVTTRVSVSSAGDQADGASGAAQLGTNRPYHPAISDSGQIVAFASLAQNLVAGEAVVNRGIFVHDRATGTTERASRKWNGFPVNAESSNPSLSADGRLVAFDTADQLAPSTYPGAKLRVWVRDRITGRLTNASTDVLLSDSNQTSNIATLSGDGRYVAFRSSGSNLVPNDTNAAPDVFLKHVAVPRVDNVSPSSVPRGTTTTVTLSGSAIWELGFVLEPAVSFGKGVSINSIESTTLTTVTVNITVEPDAEVGPRTVVATFAGTGPGPAAGATDTCACFTVL